MTGRRAYRRLTCHPGVSNLSKCPACHTQFPEIIIQDRARPRFTRRLRKSLVDAFGKEMGDEIWERFAIHYTPKHGSWLNQAEIEISLFARQCLGKRRIPDLKTLRREARIWNRGMNRGCKKINWRFDRRAARLKFGYRRKNKSFKRSKT